MFSWTVGRYGMPACLVAIVLNVTTYWAGDAFAQTSVDPKGAAMSSEDSFVRQNTTFAIDLYRQLAQESPQTNLFFSPYGISATMGMLYSGAAGPTASEIAGAAHFSLPPVELTKLFASVDPQKPAVRLGLGVGIADNKGYGIKVLNDSLPPEGQESKLRRNDLILAIDGKPIRGLEQFNQAMRHAKATAKVQRYRYSDGVIEELVLPVVPDSSAESLATNEIHRRSIRVANAVWLHSSYHLQQAYQDLMKAFNARSATLEFDREPDRSREAINHWVQEKTGNMVTDLLKEGSITPQTRLVLTNAVFFKGVWTAPFDPQKTEAGLFRMANGQAVETPLMTQEGFFPLLQTDEFSAVELPFAGDRFAMVIFLPREVNGLPKWEQTLSANNLAGWMSRLEKTRAEVTLPRFRVTSMIDLKDPLGAMGVKTVFSDQADFSPMCGDNKLKLSLLVHKASLVVTEEGATASAGTAAVVVPKSMPATFRADHPFAFLIRNVETGNVVFFGRVVTDPQELRSGKLK